MTRAHSVLLILLLVAGSLPPPQLRAQSAEAARSPPGDPQGFVLEQNYPNPANPQTWIHFRLNPSLFDSRDVVIVTMRIVNSLNQVIVIPEASDYPSGRGVRLLNLAYDEPGLKAAFWDGKDASGADVPSGVYYIQLSVQGEEEPRTRKLIVDNPRRRRGILPW